MSENSGMGSRACFLRAESDGGELHGFTRKSAAADFCEFVNSTLLPSHSLPPYFPCSISIHTAIRWLHHLGFRPMSHKKGVYIDSHEREDVIKYHGEYLKKLEELESNHLQRPACCDEEIEPSLLDQKKN